MPRRPPVCGSISASKNSLRTALSSASFMRAAGAGVPGGPARGTQAKPRAGTSTTSLACVPSNWPALIGPPMGSGPVTSSSSRATRRMKLHGFSTR